MVRLAAVETLRRFGADAVAALPALVQALADRHPEVRRAAALSLGDLGTAAECALTALTGRLSDINPRVRTAVAAALAKIQPMTGVSQITLGHR
jgi:HEAT repeat protein